MTPADIPAIPPQAVEVCEHHLQAICPLVTTATPLNVTTPNTVPGWPDLTGRIVRFEPIGDQQGAWVLIDRIGGQRWFPLRDLTLTVGGVR